MGLLTVHANDTDQIELLPEPGVTIAKKVNLSLGFDDEPWNVPHITHIWIFSIAAGCLLMIPIAWCLNLVFSVLFPHPVKSIIPLWEKPVNDNENLNLELLH